MTNPRQPDDVRLSTADLAAAGDRPSTDREVAREIQQGRADAVGDNTTQRSTTSDGDRATPLFASNETDRFRHDWTDIQAGFVDEPRQAVERADALVASAIKRLAEIFAQERSSLEHQWSQGGDVSTEDLRLALRRYRSFFDRLLSV